MSNEIFAFVAFRPCGCVCAAATPEALADMLKRKGIMRDEMQAGRVRTVANREEWMALPWRCEVCGPEQDKRAARQEKRRQKELI